jgi:hypothetical protein
MVVIVKKKIKHNLQKEKKVCSNNERRICCGGDDNVVCANDALDQRSVCGNLREQQSEIRRNVIDCAAFGAERRRQRTHRSAGGGRVRRARNVACAAAVAHSDARHSE